MRWRACSRLVALTLAGLLWASQATAGRQAVLWITHDDLMEALAGRQERRATLASLAAAGFTGVCIEAQAPDGTRTFLSRDGAALLSEIARDARRARLSVWFAWKPTAAPPGADAGEMQVIAEQGETTGSLRLVRSDQVSGNGPGELSPALRGVVSRFVHEAGALAALEPDAVLLVDFGFEGYGADASRGAERAFSFHARRSIRRWPGDVLASDAAPALAAAWRSWRTRVLRDAVLDIKAALPQKEGRRVRLMLLTAGPYRMAGERGLNWATPRAARRVGGSETAGIGENAAGHLFDGIVLGTWLPAQTEAEAASMGFQPACATAAIVADAPVEGTPRWTVLLAEGLSESEFRARLEGRMPLGEGVLVLDYRTCPLPGPAGRPPD